MITLIRYLVYSLRTASAIESILQDRSLWNLKKKKKKVKPKCVVNTCYV